MTPEQLAEVRKRDAMMKRERRANESEDDKILRRRVGADKAREHRAKLRAQRPPVLLSNKSGLSHFVSIWDLYNTVFSS